MNTTTGHENRSNGPNRKGTTMAPKNRPIYADFADRATTAKSQHFVDWLETTTGVAVDPAHAQLVLGLDKQYRSSDEAAAYRQSVADDKARAEQARKDELTAAKVARAKEQLEAAQARLAALGGAAPVDEVTAKVTGSVRAAAPAKKAPAKKAPAKKAAPAKAAPAKAAPAKAAAPDLDDDF